MRTVSKLAAAAALLVVLTACRPESPAVDSPSTTPTVVATPTAVAVTTPPSVTPTVTAAAGTEGPSIVGPPVSGTVQLHLADAWEPNPSWSEGSTQIPGRADSFVAITAPVGCSYNGLELEYRFAKQTGSLTFDVAQDLASESSSAVLDFTLLANGRTVDSKNITFSDTATLTTSLTGISAVILQVKGTSCNDQATAVVTVTQQ